MIKKLASIGGGAIGAAVFVGFLVLALLFVTLVGGVSSVISGGLGALFADEQQDDGDGDDDSCVIGEDPTTGTQQDYIRTMIGIGKTMEVPERGQIIAAMVMLQESGIQNYANGGENIRDFDSFPDPGKEFWLDAASLSLGYPHDHVGNDADSVGLFQQRASTGWADDEGGGFTAREDPETAVRRLMDPRWGAEAFFGGPGGAPNPGLLDVQGWESMPMTMAAQQVQRSAFPNAYAKWQDEATSLVRANDDAPALPLLGDGDAGGGSEGTSDVQYPMADGTYELTSPYGMREHPVTGVYKLHGGQDMAATAGTPIHAAADGEVVAAGAEAGFGNWIVVDHVLDGRTVSTVYAHMYDDGVLVSEGDSVDVGQQIGEVGSSGLSTGPHLHFEVWDGGRFDGGNPINPIPWLDDNHTSGPGGGCADDDGPPVVEDGSVEAVIDAGREWLGTPYSWGGGTVDGPSEGFGPGEGIVGFDCSSLVQHMVYNGTGRGFMLPRTSQEQYNATKSETVEFDAMKPGDLMFFGNSPTTVRHVSMYIGNGEMLHAPRTGGVVEIVPVERDDYLASTRIFDDEGSLT